MNGLTITEIAAELGISREATKKRLVRAGISPKDYAGRTAIYTYDVLKTIRSVPAPGRPKKSE
jgi:predicted transcriptional regulator